MHEHTGDDATGLSLNSTQGFYLFDFRSKIGTLVLSDVIFFEIYVIH